MGSPYTIMVRHLLGLCYASVTATGTTDGKKLNETCRRGNEWIGNLGCYNRERYTYHDKVCKCPYNDWVWNNVSTCVRGKCEYRIGWDSVAFTDPDSGNCVMRLEVHYPLERIAENVMGCPENSSFRKDNNSNEGWCSCNGGFIPANGESVQVYVTSTSQLLFSVFCFR